MTTPARIVTFASPRPGRGQSTLILHLAVALMQAGKRVGTIDADTGEAALTRYISARSEHVVHSHEALLCPAHISAAQPPKGVDAGAGFLKSALKKLQWECDIILVDTPPGEDAVTRDAVRMADALVTVLRETDNDLDLLPWAAGMVQQPAPAHWHVVRNRISRTESKDAKDALKSLVHMMPDYNFVVLPGLHHRQSFILEDGQGHIVLDTKESGGEDDKTMSDIAARQDVRQLMNAMTL